MKKTILLTQGEPKPGHLFDDSRIAPRIEAVDIYELKDLDMRPYIGLFISFHADQRFLMSQQNKLLEFLAMGKTIVYCGQVAYPFLPYLSPFVPTKGQSVENYRVHRVCEHPIFHGVEPNDLTFRKGVAGFYGRGHMPPPSNAKIIHRLGSNKGEAVDYELSTPEGGCLFVHAGNDLWSFAVENESTAHLLPKQLLDWIETRCQDN